MHIALVHNPNAGDDSPQAQDLLKIFSDANIEIDYIEVDSHYWKDRLNDPGYETVVVAGGDGTIRRVVGATYGSSTRIAVLPLGTANNMAMALDIDPELTSIISRLHAGKTRSLDLGKVEGLSSERYFMEALGVGLLAETMHALEKVKRENRNLVDDEKRAALEIMRLLSEEILRVDVDLEIDGREHSGSYILVQVMNIPSAGSNVVLAPEADPMDGMFDVVLISEHDRSRVVDYIQGLIDGERLTPEFVVNRGRSVQMQWEGSRLHVDDRIWPPAGTCPSGSRVRVSVDPIQAEFLVDDR